MYSATKLLWISPCVLDNRYLKPKTWPGQLTGGGAPKLASCGWVKDSRLFNDHWGKEAKLLDLMVL